MSDFFSKYSIEARVFPAMLGLIPFYLLQYIYLSSLFTVFSKEVISNISLSFVILYFFAEIIICYISKLFEDKIFNKKLNFPSVSFLLFGNKEYSRGFKTQIGVKIKNDFSLDLLDLKSEIKNETEARKRIKEAIFLMIGKVRDGHLLLKQNIRYGFVRNLWASSIFGLLFSVGLIIYSCIKEDYLISYFGIAMSFCYLGYLALGKNVIIYFSKNYAKKLIDEYYTS